MLSSLAARLNQSLSILQKQDIQTASQALNIGYRTQILLGDDCAAILDGDGYLLLAAEGMLPLLVDTDPWFAGWSAIMVNVSDIYAMGGNPIAVVDTLWSDRLNNDALWAGMKAASEAYNVPIVGGHTNCHSPYNALSVAILGRAKQLISSFKAQQGDLLLVAVDFQGTSHPQHNFWNAATTANPVQLRQNLALLPHLAETGLCDAGKDISMGGIIGTLLMLLETSNCGAVLNLDAIPCPQELPLERWLLSFPSYGFLLSIRPDNVAAVKSCFHNQNLICEVVGEVQQDQKLVLTSTTESVVFWDLSNQPLTGFSPP
ncbi:sll0787 family AIR synthase-like protein [Synechocystis sp. PCC 7509]|uniref:sll0787 family AIR synthase-like protein n=1 Tax=Synechocystis sp. PCC 7509 TaxID=927677 RepID=UPI0002ABC0E9|nr:sll0787 family AIR synthase-like protein [Synechocystis sp. PCC 7509]